MIISTVWEVMAIYLIIINIIGLVLMGIDKSRAKRRAFRIPEATLFSVAIFGGSVGSILGMYLFRHKTRHLKFTIGMPVILLIQIVLVLFVMFGPLWDIRVLG